MKTTVPVVGTIPAPRPEAGAAVEADTCHCGESFDTCPGCGAPRCPACEPVRSEDCLFGV